MDRIPNKNGEDLYMYEYLDELRRGKKIPPSKVASSYLQQ